MKNRKVIVKGHMQRAKMIVLVCQIACFVMISCIGDLKNLNKDRDVILPNPLPAVEVRILHAVYIYKRYPSERYL